MKKSVMKKINVLLKFIGLIIFVFCVFKIINRNVGKNISDIEFSCSGKRLDIGNFSEGMAYVGSFSDADQFSYSPSKGYYINKNGIVVLDDIKVDYGSGIFQESLSPVVKFDFSSFLYKYGYINKEGKVIINMKYPLSGEDHNVSFSEGLVAVETDDGWGYIDKNGKVAIDFQFDDTTKFSEGLAAVEKDDKWGFIDKNGNLVVDYKYDYVSSFSEDLAAVRNDDLLWGYIDKKGNIIIDLKYKSAEDFSEGLAAVKYNEKSGYIDKEGNTVIDFKYDYASSFSEGLAAVNLYHEGPIAYIDKAGNNVTDYKYFSANEFSEGRAAVCSGMHMCGYIDKTGNSITNFIYHDDVNDFSEGLASACKSSCDCVYINKNGNEVIHIGENKDDYSKTDIYGRTRVS